MTVRQSIDRQTFLANLLQSGLLSADELAGLESRLPETARGRAVARALVEQNVLTKFQAERLLAGRTGGFVLGQYRIVDELGKGGMGRVFKAVHQTMNRVVALKMLAPQLLGTPKMQQLFRRETEAAGRLHHPNIVTAYDADHVGDRFYLVMEYVDGPSLEALVRERGPLPVGLACELIRQTAEGLQHACDLGMVHRDIKPSNLLVLLPGGDSRRKHCVVKILDFGLARLQSPDAAELAGDQTIETKPNMVMGTPDFVSPEQARDLHAANIRSDLYSLGCTFYFLLTGRVPYPGGTMLEKLVRHSTREPEPIEQLRPDVPAAVIALVRRLMAKEPEDRFQTPADLATVLESYTTETNGNLALGAGLLTPPLSEQPLVPADSEDSYPTPTTDADSGCDWQAASAVSDSLSALHSTVPPDPSPTLPLELELTSVSRPRHAARSDRRRVVLAVAIALSLVGGLAGLAYLIGLR